MIRPFRLLVVLLVCLTTKDGLAQEKPAIPDVDRTRLAEAFRIGDRLGNRVWSNWDQAPFAVLLITPEYEFLIRHPRPSADFTLVGKDPLLQSNVYFRKRTQNIDFLATFPAVGGVATIVIGQAENTDKKSSTPWVVTVLHEHFHQLQMSQPSYFAEVESLNLSRGDQSGMWMLNFAFPYQNDQVATQFSRLSNLLAQALQAKTKKEFSAKLAIYLEARKAFQSLLSSDDYKYFSFQLWQEGISRYTEFRIADLAAKKYQPSKEFRSLKDYTPFKEVASSILNQQILEKLPTLQLPKSERIVFYPFGAGEGLLLDRANPRWRSRYFTEKFYLDKYFSLTK
ncbi:MAG: hypothetical protein ND895_21625 [Pyrinomonadaceae bacterium]|nr:hypothetical protein [Pyrinomonadaceae bacterium]